MIKNIWDTQGFGYKHRRIKGSQQVGSLHVPIITFIQ